MTMPALSLWQPWASLCVTRQPCGHPNGRIYERVDQWPCECKPPMVKRFETRSWPCPPNLIGSRIAIHATKRKPIRQVIGKYAVGHRATRLIRWEAGQPLDPAVDLPLGAIVGSAVIETCLPIVRPSFKPDTQGVTRIMWDGADMLLRYVLDPLDGAVDPVDISDQLPYGDWTPGRYAWQLGDAAPVQERCPWCWGVVHQIEDEVLWPCPVCDGAGRCEPIPARGRQRVWDWSP